MSRWQQPKPRSPQAALPLLAPRGRLTPTVKAQPDTAIAAGEALGLRRGGDASIGELAGAMVSALERRTRGQRLSGVMRALLIRKEVFEYLVEHPSTADEVAYALKYSILTVRPRVSELNKQHMIVDSGARRANTSGRNAIVWQVPAA